MRYIANVCSRCLLRLRGAATSSVSNLSFDNVRNKANGLFTFTGRNLFPSNQVHIRSFTSSPQEDPQSPPQLMQMRAYTWPSFFKTIKNSLLANFILKNYYDGDFDMEQFINGSLQAVEVVSTLISEGRLKELSGLVTEEAISEIKQNLNSYSLSQRLDLKISKDDIYFKFAYEIGLILPDRDKEDDKRRQVEITMVYHVLKDYENMSRNYSVPLNMATIPGYEDKLVVLNYRFFRDFALDNGGSWIINGLSHFKPLANQ